MSDRETPIKNSEKKISKLKQERSLLKSRTQVLHRDNNPNSNTREQKKRIKSIEENEKRLVEIEHEIKKEIYHLNRLSGIERASESEVDPKIKSQIKQSKISSLENLNNKSLKMTMRTPPNSRILTDDANIPQSEPNNIPTSIDALTSQLQTNFNPNETINISIENAQAFTSENILGAYGFSTPKQQTHTKTITSNIFPQISSRENFNFPPSHETEGERNERLKQEKELMNQFNSNMKNIFQSQTGAIKKTSPTQLYTQFPNFRVQEIINKNINARDCIDSERNHMNKQSYEQHFRDTNEYERQNESNSRKFEKYVPTPQRLAGKPLSSFKNNNDSYMHEQNSSPNFSNTHKGVQFTLPNSQNQYEHNANVRNIEQNEPHFNQNESYFNQNFSQPRMNNSSQFNDNRYGEFSPRTTFLKRLKQIPSFNGDSYKELKIFITKADTLYHYCSNETEENEFYEQMMFQLGEEPRNLLIGMHQPTWDMIKQKLLKHYAHLSNKDLLTSQIENLRQEKDESLSKYAERTRQLLKDRNSTYSFLSDDLRKEHNRVARRAFTNGIKNQRIRNIMTIRSSSSLEDAISYALEAENDFLARIPNGELFCRFCREIGHRANDCRRKLDDGNSINQLISALRSIGTSNRNNFRNNQWNGNGNPDLGGNRNRNFNGIWNGNFNRNRNFNGNWNRNSNGNMNRNFNRNRDRNFNENFNRNSNGNWNKNWNYNNNNNSNRNSPNQNSNGNNINNNGNNGNNGNGNQNFNANNGNNSRNNNQNRNFQQNPRQNQRSNNFAGIFEQETPINSVHYDSDSNTQHSDSEN